MQLLLVAEQQIPSGETPGTLGALERLLFGVRAFVALKMLEARERSSAGSTNVRTRLFGLGNLGASSQGRRLSTRARRALREAGLGDAFHTRHVGLICTICRHVV